jgi:pyruvate kinase
MPLLISWGLKKLINNLSDNDSSTQQNHYFMRCYMSFMDDFRHTKIICTIGPASSSSECITDLILAGMDVARLNFSHGDHQTHKEILQRIRAACKKQNKEIGILQDLGGPKIRLGKLASNEMLLKTDDIIILGTSESEDPSIIPIHYPYLLEDVSVGDRILLADGRVELIVNAKDKVHLTARVIVGGAIQSHKGLNLPSSSLRVASFTEKDKKDLEMGLMEGVDFVAISFVRHEKDVVPVKEIIERQKHRPMIIAKIETPQAVERLDAILSEVDGLMVARGDLGVEMPLEEVPLIQKRIIQAARNVGKPVITATQMLRSMMDNPRPSRAEATDVANAILDGTDALMLSDETAMGEYPVESVRILHRIARATEPHLREFSSIDEPVRTSSGSTESAIGRAASSMAAELDSPAIIAATSSGSTARLVARYRPACPVLALTPNPLTQRQLTISWGIISALVQPFRDADEIFTSARLWALENITVRKDDRLIVTAGVPVGKAGTTNLLKVLKID